MRRHPELKPFSGFTDMDGTSPNGRGHPYMTTTWGIDGTEVLKEELETISGEKTCRHWVNDEWGQE